MRITLLILTALLAGCASKTPKQPPKCSGDFRPINVIAPGNPEVTANAHSHTSKNIAC